MFIVSSATAAAPTPACRAEVAAAAAAAEAGTELIAGADDVRAADEVELVNKDSGDVMFLRCIVHMMRSRK